MLFCHVGTEDLFTCFLPFTHEIEAIQPKFPRVRIVSTLTRFTPSELFERRIVFKVVSNDNPFLPFTRLI